jgi:orotate phosphoribosyltransferase-like protein
MSGMGGFVEGEGDLVAGLLGRYPLAWLASTEMPCHVAVLLYRPEQSKGAERREREGESKGPRFKLNFLKISNKNIVTLR